MFYGNGMNQQGLFNFAARSEFQREIIKLLADGFDVLKN
jgi:hypothetical protein